MTSVEIDYAALHALTDRQLERLIAAARREQRRRDRARPVPEPQSLRVKP